MSRPVSEAEIENVVSSVRDLVSGESGAGESPAQAGQAEDKLLLTPSLRVSSRGKQKEAARRRPPATMDDAPPKATQAAPPAEQVAPAASQSEAEALRSVIADLVREEVELSLGDLVRREVQRALSERGQV